MDEQTPTISPKLRTALYAAGALLGIGVGPALLAFGLEAPAVAAGALAGACNALAFGYRPTRTVWPMAPETAGEITHGEIVRALADVKERLDGLTAAVTDSSQKSAADYVRIGHLEARIIALEDWQKWAQRLVLAAVIAAVLGVVLLDPWPA